MSGEDLGEKAVGFLSGFWAAVKRTLRVKWQSDADEVRKIRDNARLADAGVTWQDGPDAGPATAPAPASPAPVPAPAKP